MAKRTSKQLRRARVQLLKHLPDLEHLLRGSIVERYKKCGKAGCCCVGGRGHGPAYYLSVTLAPGTTRSYYVPARLRRVVAHYIRNYRRLREFNERIVQINLRLLEHGEIEGEE